MKAACVDMLRITHIALKSQTGIELFLVEVIQEIISAVACNSLPLTNGLFMRFGAHQLSIWSTFGQLKMTFLTAMFTHSGYFILL